MNDGGPAFPHSSQPLDAQGNPMCSEHSEWGMSLRDWFAGQALVGLLTRTAELEIGTHYFAAAAYKMADTMIAARNQSKP